MSWQRRRTGSCSSCSKLARSDVLRTALGSDPRRRSSQILGTVFLYADYTVPVEAVRSALQQIVRDAPLWDGRVCNLQVTNATEQTVELRALVSAADSGEAWELRVYVREKLLAYLQREHPGALPRARVVLTPESGEGGPPPA